MFEKERERRVSMTGDGDAQKRLSSEVRSRHNRTVWVWAKKSRGIQQ